MFRAEPAMDKARVGIFLHLFLFLLPTFEFISGEEGSETVFQGYHGTPEPAGDAGNNKSAGGGRVKGRGASQGQHKSSQGVTIFFKHVIAFLTHAVFFLQASYECKHSSPPKVINYSYLSPSNTAHYILTSSKSFLPLLCNL